MKAFKIIYYILTVFIGAIAILLIGSVIPIAGNYKLMVVQSGSMEPVIKMGSMIVVKPSEDYKIGDMISFMNRVEREESITHRIIDLEVIEGESFYVTKGDANEDPDPRRVAKRDIIGKVLFSIPYFGYAVDFAKKPLGFALIIILPASIIILDEARKIYEEIKKKPV